MRKPRRFQSRPASKRKPWARGTGPDKRIRGRRGQNLRREHLAREPLCRPCKAEGVTTVATIVDHIIPLEMGGTEDPGNKQSLCDPHNEAKTKADKVAIAKWKVERQRR